MCNSGVFQMGAGTEPEPHRATDQNLVPEQVQGSFL